MSLEYVSGTLDLSTKYRYLHSFNFAENAADPGAEARITIRDTNASGSAFVDIRLAAKESKHVSFRRPLFFPGGMHITVSGTARGSIEAE